MCHNHTLTKNPQPPPKKTCTLCCEEKWQPSPKCETVDTTNLQPWYLLHLDFEFYIVTSIRCFTSILPVVCAMTRILWILPTESKIPQVIIIHFILTILNNEQRTCKHMTVDEDGDLEISKYLTEIIVDESNVDLETNGGDA